MSPDDVRVMRAKGTVGSTHYVVSGGQYGPHKLCNGSRIDGRRWTQTQATPDCGKCNRTYQRRVAASGTV